MRVEMMAGQGLAVSHTTMMRWYSAVSLKIGCAQRAALDQTINFLTPGIVLRRNLAHFSAAGDNRV
jgi:hypothetical protein